MRLSKIKWDGPGTMEELVIWGTGPLKEFLEIIDEEMQEYEGIGAPGDEGLRQTVGRVIFCYYEMRHKLEELEQTIYRLADEMDPTKQVSAMEQ